jgi:hypothetical protein
MLRLTQCLARGAFGLCLLISLHATAQATPISNKSASGATTVAGIGAGSWSWIGPSNLSGRVRAIAIHPTQPATMWIGSAGAGIWKTTDGGATWARASEGIGNVSVTSIIFAPGNPTVMYAGTGQEQQGLRGGGIFKSTNGGATWTALATPMTANTAGSNFVQRLAVHPTNANTLLAATNFGLLHSTDAGATWVLRSDALLRILDVDFDPMDGSNALAFWGGIHRSTDAGNSWSQTDFFDATNWVLSVGRIEVAYSRQSGVVYALLDNSGAPAVRGNLYRSSDGGVKWTLQSSPLRDEAQGVSGTAIWVDPTNSNHLIVGGQDLYRSTNAGVNWTRISSGMQAGSVPSGHNAIVSPPAYDGAGNRTIFFGANGGFYKAADIAAVTAPNVGWTGLNNGLSIAQFRGAAGHAGTNGRIVGGAAGLGSLVYSGSGTQWSIAARGDGAASAIDPTDGNYFFGANSYLRMHRGTNGANAFDIPNGLADAGSMANYLAPFALDPNNPSTVIAGGRSLWRTTNAKAAAPTWSAIMNLTGDGSPVTYISQVAVAKGNSNLVWVGKNNGSLYKSVNGAAAIPTFLSKGCCYVLPERPVLSLLIDKDSPSTVYAGFGGFGSYGIANDYVSDNLWRSSDGGEGWASIGIKLPPGPVRTIERHPVMPGYLYVGTDLGLFASEDSGATWIAAPDGPGNVRIDHLSWYDATTLLVATHGRGMYSAAVSVTPVTYPLTITKSGAGSGPVTSIPAGITCGSSCTQNVPAGTFVTLNAKPNPGSVFANWYGSCDGGVPTCTVQINGPTNVTAAFVQASTTQVTVFKAGSGSGVVNSMPAGIGCGSACSASFHPRSYVWLTATPDAGSTFKGWSGHCYGTDTCFLIVDSAKSVTAVFDRSYKKLVVAKSGSGSGPVTSSPAGITCGSSCSADFSAGSNVTLTATANSGSVFAGWSGACTGTSPTCVVGMNDAKNVTATYNKAGYALTVAKGGTGSGPVTSSPAGIVCGSSCSANFAPGSSVTLTAAPNNGSAFGGWSGACAGMAATCTVAIDAAKSVTAMFAAVHALTVSKSGPGTVSTAPAGISCGPTCSAAFAHGTSVTLTAMPDGLSTFTGWSGACTGTSSTCVVSMTQARSVTATFTSLFGSAPR